MPHVGRGGQYADQHGQPDQNEEPLTDASHQPPAQP